MLAMAAASVVLGLGANFVSREPLPLWRQPALAPTAATEVPVGEVDADFLLQAGHAPGTLLLDARAAAAYEAGHIPGALSLPLERFAAAFAELEPQLRTAGMLVLYCSDRACGDSPELARRLWAKGLKNLLLYSGGMEDWSGRGHAVEK
ncbi:MAG: rhodanese-like domain-containing protein [Acidobacteria bacterium]|jgi:rhodanese-related sulfurtransferase|nr:rhodanese-like domain-containing protein [Acidobacteriota bacterium]